MYRRVPVYCAGCMKQTGERTVSADDHTPYVLTWHPECHWNFLFRAKVDRGVSKEGAD